MKVLFLTAEIPYPPIGGSKVKSYNFIRELSVNHEVHLCSFVTPEDEKHADKLKPYCKKIETVKLELSETSALKKTLRLLRPTPDYLVPYMNRRMADRIETLLSQTSYDIIHVETIKMGIYGMRKKGEERGRPFRVLGEYDCISEYYRQVSVLEKHLGRKLFMGLQSFKMAALEKRLYRNYDSSILVTEHDRRLMVKRVGPLPRIDVVPNGANLDFFSPGDEKPTEYPSAVFTGYMSYPFNDDAAQFFISDVYPLIKRKMPEFKIFFVGIHPSERLKGFAQRDADVVVTGYVPDIRPYVRQAWAFVSPLRYGTGINNKMLEAFSMGKAVVASTISCNGIEVKDGRDALVADGAEATAERIVFLLEREDIRKKLGGNARSLVVENYSWEKIISKVEKIYESIKNTK